LKKAQLRGRKEKKGRRGRKKVKNHRFRGTKIVSLVFSNEVPSKSDENEKGQIK